MRIHPRHELVRRAKLRIEEVIDSNHLTDDLTPIECADIFLELSECFVCLALRLERHGRCDKKADEE